MAVEIFAYFGGDFDQMFSDYILRAGTSVHSASATRVVYAQSVTIGGNQVFFTPQLVLEGTGFGPGSAGTIASIVIGFQSSSFAGADPVFAVQGLNIPRALFDQDALAAIRSTAVIFNGSSATDIFTGSAFGDVLVGFAGADTLMGGTGSDVLRGGPGADRLFGGKGGDTLIGGADDDVLTGGMGPDQLDGGAGINDMASYLTADTGILVDLANSLLNTGHAAGDTYIGIESIEGGAFTDALFGNDQNNRIYGGLGADTIYGRAGNDVLIDGGQMSGPNGLDNAADFLFGGQGKDILMAFSGEDTLTGGAGSDHFHMQGGVGTGNDVITDFTLQDDTLSLFGFGFHDHDAFVAAQEQVGSNLVIHAESGVTLTILNMNKAAFGSFADVNYDL